MRTITLEDAFGILSDASAVIWDDDYLSYPSLSDLKWEDKNEFLYLSGGAEYTVDATFKEENNRSVKVDGCRIFLTDDEGEEVQITVLGVVELESD